MYRMNEIVYTIKQTEMGTIFNGNHGMSNPVLYINKKQCAIEEAQAFIAKHGKALCTELRLVPAGEQRHINLSETR